MCFSQWYVPVLIFFFLKYFSPRRSRRGTLGISSPGGPVEEPLKPFCSFFSLRRLSSSVVFQWGSLRQTLDLSKTTNEKVPWRRPSNIEIYVLYTKYHLGFFACGWPGWCHGHPGHPGHRLMSPWSPRYGTLAYFLSKMFVEVPRWPSACNHWTTTRNLVIWLILWPLSMVVFLYVFTCTTKNLSTALDGSSATTETSLSDPKKA